LAVIFAHQHDGEAWHDAALGFQIRCLPRDDRPHFCRHRLAVNDLCAHACIVPCV
jgi:hypothetical protein